MQVVIGGGQYGTPLTFVSVPTAGEPAEKILTLGTEFADSIMFHRRLSDGTHLMMDRRFRAIRVDSDGVIKWAKPSFMYDSAFTAAKEAAYIAKFPGMNITTPDGNHPYLTNAPYLSQDSNFYLKALSDTQYAFILAEANAGIEVDTSYSAKEAVGWVFNLDIETGAVTFVRILAVTVAGFNGYNANILRVNSSAAYLYCDGMTGGNTVKVPLDGSAPTVYNVTNTATASNSQLLLGAESESPNYCLYNTSTYALACVPIDASYADWNAIVAASTITPTVSRIVVGSNTYRVAEGNGYAGVPLNVGNVAYICVRATSGADPDKQVIFKVDLGNAANPISALTGEFLIPPFTDSAGSNILAGKQHVIHMDEGTGVAKLVGPNGLTLVDLTMSNIISSTKLRYDYDEWFVYAPFFFETPSYKIDVSISNAVNSDQLEVILIDQSSGQAIRKGITVANLKELVCLTNDSKMVVCKPPTSAQNAQVKGNLIPSLRAE